MCDLVVRDSNENVYFVTELIVDSLQNEVKCWCCQKNEQKPKCKSKNDNNNDQLNFIDANQTKHDNQDYPIKYEIWIEIFEFAYECVCKKKIEAHKIYTAYVWCT